MLDDFYGIDGDELPDPSQWPDEHWQEIDSLLRCGICQEFMNGTKTLLLCNHSFCSLCLQEALEYQQSVSKLCPTCRTPIETSGGSSTNLVVKNRVLDELILRFIKVRKKTIEAIKMLKRPPEQQKSDIGDTVTESHINPHQSSPSDRPNTRSKNKLASNEGNKSPSEKYKCPICFSHFAGLSALSMHVEACLDKPNNQAKATKRDRDVDATSDSYPVFQKKSDISFKKNNMKPMKKPWYTGMKDKQLKDECKKLGLSTAGTRAALKMRHEQFIKYWNAACDEIQPKSQRSILKMVKDWENRQNGSSKAKISDFVAHQTAHKDQFAELIKKARNPSMEDSVANQHKKIE